MISLRYTDPILGQSVIALILDQDGNIWNNVSLAFAAPPRVANNEIALTEQTTNFPGLYAGTVTLPTTFTGTIMVRFEVSGDVLKKPLGVSDLLIVEGELYDPTNPSVLPNILNLTVNNTGVDSNPDLTLGELLEEILACLKGTVRVDRTAREYKLHHLNGLPLRTLALETTTSEVSRIAPSDLP